MRHVLLSLMCLLAACGGDSPDVASPVEEEAASSSLVEAPHTTEVPTSYPRSTDACVGQPRVTWESWGEGFFRGYCTACHSREVEDRWGAPEGIDFDTKEDVTSRKQQIQSSVLDSDRMPVGGGVVEADLELLQIFLSCGL